MPGSFIYWLWSLETILEVTVVVCALAKHSFRRYLCLNLYMLFSLVVSVGRYQALSHFGLQSPQYAYFYFYSDAVLTIFLYVALITLYVHVFDEMETGKYVRLFAVLLLAATALFSYLVVQQSQHRMLTHFFFELSQNLYFVGLVLTYVLWGAILAPAGGRAHGAFAARGGATLMATLIFLFSAAALLQFFISYCRSLIAASIKQPLSAEVRDVTGIASAASGDDFARVIQLLQLCPERPEDQSEIRAIGAYFRLLNFVRATVARIIPALVAWTEMERGQCAYFAAVALERRIAFSRDMLSQQLDA